MDKIFSKIKNQKLTPEERSEMLIVLNKYMKENPKQDFLSKPVRSPFYSTVWEISKQKRVALPVTAVIIFVLTTSTVFGANNSLPGDVLYPVKRFGETVQSVAAIGTKAKAKVSTEHAISRLEEAAELASRGGLTEDKVLELEDDFKKHFDKIEKNIEELKNEGDEDNAEKLMAVFEDTVSLQGEDFDKLTENEDVDEGSKENLRKIRSKLEDEVIKKKKERDIEKEHKKVEGLDRELKKEDNFNTSDDDEGYEEKEVSGRDRDGD